MKKDRVNMKAALSVEEIVEASVAIFEKNNGYYKTNNYDVVYGLRKSNLSLMYDYFMTPKSERVLFITESHRKKAKDIIFHLNNFYVNALKGTITKFESRVLDFISSGYGVKSKSLFSIAASFPLIYHHDKTLENWKTKKETICKKSKFIDNIYDSINLENITIGYIRHNIDIEGHAEIDAFTENGDILEFICFDNQKIKLEIGDKINISGRIYKHVKKHGYNKTLFSNVLLEHQTTIT